jgi:glycosyltransferase involved in cell wall biosynthesis
MKSVPVRHKIVLNGYMEHEKLIQYLTEKADILINTTRTMGVGNQNAGFPFKMMEYAAVGRPIVSSSIGRLDEEFNNHVTYYDEDNPENVANSINFVIDHYEELATKALVLQKIAIEKYTIEGVAKTLKPLIEKCTTNDTETIH